MDDKTVLVLRTCNADMTSYGGFRWPESGPVEAPDWIANDSCGNGLHGLPWGEGSAGLLDMSSDAKWIVFRATVADMRHGAGELQDKCKCARGLVEYCGNRDGAIAYLAAHRADLSRSGVFGTATAGYCGTATAGVCGTATAGDRGTATAGYCGTATAGDSGTATAGYKGTATAGLGGVITILRWNGKRYRAVMATIKDEDGDGQLEPNTPYRLDSSGSFVRAQ